MRKKLNRTALFLAGWIKNRTLRIRRFDRWDLGVLVLILVYGSVFSYFTVLKHDVFRTFAWDLGIFNQTLFTTIHGKFLYYTCELYMVPSGCYFAAHFSPILFLVLPFYAVSPSAETLLIIGSFALSFAAVPLYFSVRTALENKKIAFIFVLLYLLYPAIQAANWFDFHVQQLLPLFIFSGFYFLQKKQWKLYLFSILLALMIEEHVPFLVFLMCFYFLITGEPRTIPKAIKSREFNQALVSLLGMILSVIWFFLAQYIKGAFYINPEFTTRYLATGAFSILGVETNPLLLPVYIFLNPQLAWSALMYDYPTKLYFIILLFGPLLFLPLRSKFSLVPIVLLIPSMVSNYIAYYTLGAHYPLYVAPLIFMAFILAVKKLDVNIRLSLLKTSLIITTLLIASTSPLSPISTTFAVSKAGILWYPDISFAPSKHVETMQQLLQLVPSDASILTQNHIFPHISARMNAYVIPPIGHFENDSSYLDKLLAKSDYVFLDLYNWDPLTAEVYDQVMKNQSYGLYGLGSMSLLLKKGYTGEPLFNASPDNRVYAASKDLAQSASDKIVSDPSAESGECVLSTMGTSGIVTFGPYDYLLKGTYQVTFTVKAGEHGDGCIGTLEVGSDYGQFILSKRDFFGFEMDPNKWTNFTLEFTSTELGRGIEYLTYNSGLTNLYIDKIYVRRISTSADSDFGLKTLAPGSAHPTGETVLRISTGNQTEGGFFVHYSNSTGAVFWFGPYWSLTRGNYTAEFYLKVLPYPQPTNESIITLQISADNGANSVAEYQAYSSAFHDQSGISNWHKFSLDFEVTDTIRQVEFRGLEPSPNYDIYLAYVLVEKTR